MRASLSPLLSSLANAFRIPIQQMSRTPLSCNSITQTRNGSLTKSSILSSVRPFSSTTLVAAPGKGRSKVDRRITLIRYFLSHSKTPRPLRFSRNRYLRHWTIHRAWQLYQAKCRATHQLELERQYNCMRAACEELRTGIGDGGRLFRRSMIKTGVFTKGPPIEYGRLQTDSPGQEGWNYDWRA